MIATVDAAGHYQVVHNAREPVRLGNDVFATGRIAPATMKSALEAFRRFREELSKYSINRFKAVATSALREAEMAAFLSLKWRNGTALQFPLSALRREARLVHLAVKERVRLNSKMALLVDIGGGSVEISLANRNGIISTQSYAWAVFVY